jgi:hypothetical protein
MISFDRPLQPPFRLLKGARPREKPVNSYPAGPGNGEPSRMTDPWNHRIHIQDRRDRVFVGAPFRYRAECKDCGWAGEWEPTEERAEADGQAHQAEHEPLEAA